MPWLASRHAVRPLIASAAASASAWRAERHVWRATNVVAAELHDHVMKRRQLRSQAGQGRAGVGMGMDDERRLGQTSGRPPRASPTRWTGVPFVANASRQVMHADQARSPSRGRRRTG